MALAGVIFGALYKAKVDKELERLRVTHARDLEEAKANITRRDGLRKELQSLMSQLAMQFSTAIHAMQWVTWFVRARPSTLTAERLDEYNKDMRAALPQIMGVHIAIAMLDEQIAGSVSELVEALYQLDANIAHLGLRLPDEREMVQQGLADYWEDVRTLERRVNGKLTQIAVSKGFALSGSLPDNV